MNLFRKNKLRSLAYEDISDAWMILAVVVITLALLFAVRKAEGQTTRPVLFGTSVWYQPTESFTEWRSRGVKTLIGCPDIANLDKWCAAAKAADLTYWLQYSPATVKHAIDPQLLGFVIQPDEPNGVGNATPEACLAQYRQIKVLTKKPVMLNLDGRPMRFPTPIPWSRYLMACDVLAFDIYPLNGGDGPESIPMIGTLLDRIHSINPALPVVVFIESSDQDLRISDWGKSPDATGQPLGRLMRGPTAAEFTAELNTAVAHGAAGIALFPDIIGRGWEKFDGTPPDVIAALKVFNAVPIVFPPTLTPTTKPAAPPAATQPIAPRLAIRTRVLTTGNPTLIQIPNIRWTDDGKGTSPDTNGKPRWVYDFDAHDEMVALGYEEAWMIGDGTLNTAPMWTTTDVAGNPHLAVGLHHDDLDWSLSGNHNSPPDRNVSLAIGQLIAHPQFFRPNGIKSHGMVIFDVEGSPIVNHVWSGSPLADRLAAVQALTQSIKWIRQEAGGDQEVCVYQDHALYATTWGPEPEIQNALAEFTHTVSLRAPFLYANDWQAENAASWQSNFDALVHNVNRFSPEHSQTVVITLCPVYQVYYPDKVSPDAAKLNGQPIPMPVWMNMVDAVAAKGYTIFVWTGNTPVEPIREQLRYVAGYQRGKN